MRVMSFNVLYCLWVFYLHPSAWMLLVRSPLHFIWMHRKRKVSRKGKKGKPGICPNPRTAGNRITLCNLVKFLPRWKQMYLTHPLVGGQRLQRSVQLAFKQDLIMSFWLYSTDSPIMFSSFFSEYEVRLWVNSKRISTTILAFCHVKKTNFYVFYCFRPTQCSAYCTCKVSNFKKGGMHFNFKVFNLFYCDAPSRIPRNQKLPDFSMKRVC